MTKLRYICLWVVLTVVLVVLAAGFYSGYRWQSFKQQQGIETLVVDGLRLSLQGLQLRDFLLVRRSEDGEQLKAQIKDLTITLDSWLRPLPFRAISAAHLDLDWQPEPKKADDAEDNDIARLPSRDDIETWAHWLPREGTVASFALALPCAKERCQEKGELRWQHAGSQALPAELNLTLRRDTHRLSLLANVYEQPTATHVDLQLRLDDVERLTLQNQFTPSGDATLWGGALAMNELPEAPWLLAWLGDWLAYTPPTLPKLPEQMRIGAGWAFRLDTSAPLDSWQAMDGELRLSANLPAPWPIVGIGQVSGRLDVNTRADGGIWIPTELTADLALLPADDLFAELPAPLRPSAVSLKISQAAASESNQALPLSVQLSASGPSPLTLETLLVMETAAPYAASFDKTRLKLRSPTLTGPDVVLKALEADLRLSGQATRQGAVVRLAKGSRLTVNSLTVASGVAASKLQIELAGLAAEAGIADGQLHRLTVNGQTAVSLGKLQQTALRAQGWQWTGALNADLERVSLEGPLSNDAALTLPLALTYNLPDSRTRLDARLPELFLRAGNPLAATLADWPKELELNNGRLQGQAQFNLPGSGPLAATARLSAKGLGGIYDRTELSGLDAEVLVALQGNQLRLDLSELTLREANPGFTFGPLRFNGEYAGPLDNLADGRLAWSTAEVRLLGGRLWLDPGVADLAADTQQLKAHLRGLQLPLLLEAYPAEGLSGTGVIDGEMLVQRSPAGISIEHGSLDAREPGGALQFRSPKIQALGQSNPAMRLVTEALDDFHYDLLTSDVRYAADGTLNLGLKLHGRNPALEGGRPINFSINLEEDIPALLTSLQLSDRVSETIQRRVQERLR
jgi:hypothetical protein